MSEAILIGIDEGTTAVKVGSFDLQLRPLARARREIATNHPTPGLVEQDPEEILEAVVDAVAEVLAATPERASSRLAVRESAFEQRLTSAPAATPSGERRGGEQRGQGQGGGAEGAGGEQGRTVNGARARPKPLSGREDAERAFLALCIASPDDGAQMLASVDIDEHFSSELLRRAAGEMARKDAAFLSKRSLFAHTVIVKVRYRGFYTVTRTESKKRPTCDPDELAARAVSLLERTEAGTRPVRLLGVSLHGLTDSPSAAPGAQLPLLPE